MEVIFRIIARLVKQFVFIVKDCGATLKGGGGDGGGEEGEG